MRRVKEKDSGKNFEQIKLFTLEEEVLSSGPKNGQSEDKVREEENEKGCPCYFGICSECEEYKESKRRLMKEFEDDIVEKGIF